MGNDVGDPCGGDVGDDAAVALAGIVVVESTTTAAAAVPVEIDTRRDGAVPSLRGDRERGGEEEEEEGGGV